MKAKQLGRVSEEEGRNCTARVELRFPACGCVVGGAFSNSCSYYKSRALARQVHLLFI